jgi:hypothetical protein
VAACISCPHRPNIGALYLNTAATELHSALPDRRSRQDLCVTDQCARLALSPNGLFQYISDKLLINCVCKIYCSFSI